MTPRLITSRDYIDDVVRSINRAHRRIYCLSLIFQQDTITEPLISALLRAAERHVSVNVAADFTTYSYAAGHGRPATILSDATVSTTGMVHRFRASGVSFRWLGQGGFFIFAGRTHSKWIIADDTVYCFGGMNLDNPSMSNADFMLKVTDAELAKQLIEEYQRIITGDMLGTRNLSYSLPSPYGTIYFDGGIPGESLIYRRACRLAAQAASIVFVSQYCPTGSLARSLRDKPSEIYYNHPQASDSYTAKFIRVSQNSARLKNDYAREPYIHAKILLVTLPDGSKTVITGSHNFASLGVLAGTREIALETSDPHIVGMIEEFIQKEIV